MLTLLLSALCLAAPNTIAHQGRLLNANGDPITQATDLTVQLYDASGQSVYSESFAQVPFDSGYFSVRIGEDGALTAAQLDQAVSVALSVNGGAELSATPLNAAPFALIAQKVRGGSVEASEISVGGQLVIDSAGDYQGTVDWSKLANTPVDSDLLASLSCSEAEPLLTFSGGAWVCASPSSHSTLTSDLSGVIDPVHLKFGTGPADIAPGDHGHAELLATSGGTLTGPLKGTVGEFSGGVVLGANASCVDGAMRWTDQLQVCAGTRWFTVFTPQGQDAAYPALSCAALHNSSPQLRSGLYWIDPNGGATTDAFEAYCEMTLDGGGWTVLVNNDNTDTEPSGCVPRIGSDPSFACGAVAATSDFVISAAGLSFSELIWATHSGDFQAPSAYTAMSWSSPVAIPSGTAAWNLIADTAQRTLPTWANLPQLTCTYANYTAPSAIGNTLPLSGAYGTTEVVTVLANNAAFTTGFMSFTDYDAWSSTQSNMKGFDDFQDGRACSDQWAPQSERGKSSFIMVR